MPGDKNGQAPVYQFRYDHGDAFAAEDRPPGDKEIHEMPVPDVEKLDTFWDMSPLLMWPAAADIYEPMSKNEIQRMRSISSVVAF